MYEKIQSEHPDVSYFKKEEISLILSKGLAVTCRDQPRNPIEYFAEWLMQYDKVQKRAKAQVEENETVEKLK